MDESLAAQAGRLLRENHKTLAVAESCTGGLLAHLVTSIPGSSDYFLGGFVTYSNAAKINFLDVPSETIERHGAVSKETAEAMANGVRLQFNSDVALSVTGIAGPGGGTPEKPIGLTWIGISLADGTKAIRHLFQHDRAGNQNAAAGEALRMLIGELESGSEPALQVEVEGVVNGLPRVVAFRWRGSRYLIRDYGRHWKDGQRMNWLVRTSPPGVFQVSCDRTGGKWKVQKRSQPARPA